MARTPVLKPREVVALLQRLGCRHEVRTSSIRASVIEAACAKTDFDDTAGGLANRLRLLRRFAPSRAVDARIRTSLRLDAHVASPRAAGVSG